MAVKAAQQPMAPKKTPDFAWIIESPRKSEQVGVEEGETFGEFNTRVREYAFVDDTL